MRNIPAQTDSFWPFSRPCGHAAERRVVALFVLARLSPADFCSARFRAPNLYSPFRLRIAVFIAPVVRSLHKEYFPLTVGMEVDFAPAQVLEAAAVNIVQRATLTCLASLCGLDASLSEHSSDYRGVASMVGQSDLAISERQRLNGTNSVTD